MKLIDTHHHQVACWVSLQIPECFPKDSEPHAFGWCRSVGFVNSAGTLVGGFVFYNWNERAKRCEIAAACIDPKGLTKRLIGQALGHPFKNGIEKIVSFVRIGNDRSLSNTIRLGFEREAEIPNHFGAGLHAVMSALYRDRWGKIYGRF